jgi:O-antigen/teichoic acid export membrane protein
VSQILARLASFLLLPVYTTYLTPADYGYIAILDLTTAILAILVGSGMASAVNRYHFEAHDQTERDTVWWTGLTILTLGATVFVSLAWLLRHPLARITLGSNYDQGSYYYTLVLLTLWFSLVGSLPDTYLRVRKWSTRSVKVSMAHLLLNIALNLYFLVVLKLGVHGILLGNLLTSVVRTTLLLIIFWSSQGPYTLRWSLVRDLGNFGVPIALTTLLSLTMHQADRYLLRLFLDMERVGLYSFAYTIGQAINTICLGPFVAIWSVEIYEIAQRPNAKQLYALIFQYFIYGLLLVMLGVSLFIKPLLTLLVKPAYLEAASLIPIVCLAYIFFSLHEHFKVPALLAKKTSFLLPAYVVAAITNISMNLIAIPWLGTAGAAWTSVLTFATFSFVGLWRYRTLDRIHYSLLRCGLVLVGMSTSYIAEQVLIDWYFHGMWTFILAATIWSSWAIGLFMPLMKRFAPTREWGMRRRPALVQAHPVNERERHGMDQ